MRLIAVLTLAVVAMICVSRSGSAANYDVDPVHSAITFKVSHMGVGWVHGRFNSFSGSFSVDAGKPAGDSFTARIRTDSVDSGDKKRDEHLASPDFFNAKQFPAIEFKSTAVKATQDGLDVTGNFTMHGVTKPITVSLKGGKTVEFPPGMHRTGYSGQTTIKRSDFKIDKFTDMIGDEVLVDFSLEGTQK